MPHLIFDMDGTIIDSMPVHRSSWAQFAARHGLSEQAEELERATSGRTGIEGMRALFGAELSLELAQAYVHEKEALYREQFGAQFRWVGGFERFAMWARTLGLRCGLGTAGDRHNVRFCLERLPKPDLDGLFEVCVGGDEGLPVTVLTIQTADPEVIEALRHGATYSIELVEIGEPSLTPPLEEQA